MNILQAHRRAAQTANAGVPRTDHNEWLKAYTRAWECALLEVDEPYDDVLDEYAKRAREVLNG